MQLRNWQWQTQQRNENEEKNIASDEISKRFSRNKDERHGNRFLLILGNISLLYLLCSFHPHKNHNETNKYIQLMSIVVNAMTTI